PQDDPDVLRGGPAARLHRGRQVPVRDAGGVGEAVPRDAADRAHHEARGARDAARLVRPVLVRVPRRASNEDQSATHPRAGGHVKAHITKYDRELVEVSRRFLDGAAKNPESRAMLEKYGFSAEEQARGEHLARE